MIWLIGIIISIPFLWMTEYITNPDQCHLDISGSHIIYILVLNTVFIFLPSICLTVLYVLIIIKLKKLNIMKKKSLFVNENENEESILNLNRKKNYFKITILDTLLEKDLQSKSKKHLNYMRISSISYADKIKLTRIISLITMTFFCCHLPVRIFLVWAYLSHYVDPIDITIIQNESIKESNNFFSFINLLSHLTTLVYFLHCISNPIIYNVFSIKFRKAFMKLIRL